MLAIGGMMAVSPMNGWRLIERLLGAPFKHRAFDAT
jgi:hypothetical protein